MSAEKLVRRKDVRTTHRLHVLFLPSGIALLAIIVLCRLLLPDFYAQLQTWQGYYTVAYEKLTDSPDISSTDMTIDNEGLISRDTTFVYVSVINDVDRISLSEANRRLLPVDPRRDPYIASLDGYFVAADRSIIYARADAPPWVVAWRTRKILSSVAQSIRVIEWPVILVGFRFFCIGAVLVILAIRSKKRDRRAILLGLIPLGISAVQGGTWGLVTSLSLSIGWGMLVPRRNLLLKSILTDFSSHERNNLQTSEVISIAVSVAVAVISLPFQPQSSIALVSFLLTCLSLLSIVLIDVGYTRHANLVREHRVFDPILLLRGEVLHRKLRIPAIALVLGFAVLPVVEWSASLYIRRDMPTPERVRTTSRDSWRDLQVMFEEGSGALPSLPEYFAHVAYQQFIQVSRSYAFPVEGSAIEVSTFSKVDDRIVRTAKKVVVFDTIWFAEALGSARNSGIPGMLIEQGSLIRVVRSNTPRRSSVIAYIVYLAVIGVLVTVAGTDLFRVSLIGFFKRFAIRNAGKESVA